MVITMNNSVSYHSMKQNIGVIGGGFTGLTAAYDLLKIGHRVTVFEAKKNLGGLAGGFKLNGKSLEMAYHHIFKTDEDIIGLIDELGLEKKLTWKESSIGLYYDKAIYPFVTPMDLLKFKPLGLVGKIRLGIIGLYLQKTNNYQSFLKVPACKWMEKMCGNNAYRVIWEPLLKGKFHDYYKAVSMAWLWARIHTRANSKEKGDTKEYLGYFEGGFQVIIDALEKNIAKMGGEILLDSPVVSIKNVKNRVLVTSRNKRRTFDKVVASVPSHIFAKTTQDLNKNYVDRLNSINYLSAVILVFSSKQSLSRYYWHNINDLKSPFLAFLQHTNLVDKSNYGNKEVYYAGTYIPNDHKYFDMKDEEIKNEFFDYLKKVFPDFEESEINSSYVFKLKNAQHIVSCDYPDKMPNYVTPLKNVFLANFSQIFPEDRGINFAVREGRKIAKIVVDRN